MNINNINFKVILLEDDEIYEYSFSSSLDLSKGISYIYRNINYDIMKNLDPIFISSSTANFPNKDKITNIINSIRLELFEKIYNVDMKNVLSKNNKISPIIFEYFNTKKEFDKLVHVGIFCIL